MTKTEQLKTLQEALKACGYDPDKIIKGYLAYKENMEIKRLVKAITCQPGN